MLHLSDHNGFTPAMQICSIKAARNLLQQQCHQIKPYSDRGSGVSPRHVLVIA